MGVLFSIFALSVGAAAAAAAYVGTFEKLEHPLPIIFAVLAGVGACGTLGITYLKG